MFIRIKTAIKSDTCINNQEANLSHINVTTVNNQEANLSHINVTTVNNQEANLSHINATTVNKFKTQSLSQMAMVSRVQLKSRSKKYLKTTKSCKNATRKQKFTSQRSSAVFHQFGTYIFCTFSSCICSPPLPSVFIETSRFASSTSRSTAALCSSGLVSVVSALITFGSYFSTGSFLT